MRQLSVVVITYNEEKNIGRCIDSVSTVADEVIILDSYSNDRTVAIAKEKGALVKQCFFDGYISQKNKVIQMASHDLVLLLDADEAPDERLVHSIEAAKNGTAMAYMMNRSNFFLGAFVRYGLWYPDRKLRLFDKRYGSCGGLNPHDRVIMQSDVRPIVLKGDLEHYTFETMEAYLRRNDAVSTIAARSLYETGTSRPWSKMFFSAAWTFINGYFLRMGFLDGRRGWIIAVHTTKQSFSKYQKLRRLHRAAPESMSLTKSNA